MTSRHTKPAARLPRNANDVAWAWFDLSNPPPPPPPRNYSPEAIEGMIQKGHTDPQLSVVKKDFSFGHISEGPGETTSYIFPVLTNGSKHISKEDTLKLFRNVLAASVNGHREKKSSS